jgi:hypothetical protein
MADKPSLARPLCRLTVIAAAPPSTCNRVCAASASVQVAHVQCSDSGHSQDPPLISRTPYLYDDSLGGEVRFAFSCLRPP